MHGVHVDRSSKRTLNRIKRIQGQLNGVVRMIETDRYCIDVITQTGAIKRALSSLEDEMLKSHLAHCIFGRTKDGQLKVALSEVLKVYSLKRK